MKMTRVCSLIGISIISATQGTLALADSPLGWIHSNNTSAYTLGQFELETTISKLAVNDDIDFLDVREDLLAGTRKLQGDSGDLTGHHFDIHLGLTSYLTAFYTRQEHDLKIELGEIASVNMLDIDDGLSTTSTSYGLKWNFYEAGYFDNARPWHAASLELSRTSNKSEDYSVLIDSLDVDTNFTVSFSQPQSFGIQDMEDDGWKARILYTLALGQQISTTFWLGYAENEARSGTGSTLSSESSLAPAFEQTFNSEEKQVLIGAGFNWQITPRMPLQLSYEYIRLNDAELTAEVNALNSILPSFLRGDSLSAESGDNHTLKGSLSYWLTPKIHASLVGNLYSNQFLGAIPHYNNPLSGSFAENPYGYLGVRLGAAF